MARNRLFLFLTAVLIWGSSCDRSRVYESYRAVGTDGWHLDSTMTFPLELEEGSRTYDGYLALRVNAGYPYQNLYIFVDQRFDDGSSRLDTVNFRIAAPSGALLGKGSGAVKEFRLPVFKDNDLPRPGNYEIRFTHGMRDTQLVGIEDVGFRLALHNEDS